MKNETNFPLQQRVRKEGYLIKSPPLDKKLSSIKRWHERYIILTDEGLYYFKNKRSYEKNKKERGFVIIDEGTDIKKHEGPFLGYSHVLVIRLPGRTYYLSAASEIEANEWHRTLMAQIERCQAERMRNEEMKRQARSIAPPRQRIIGEGGTDGHPNLDCNCPGSRNNDNGATAACVNRNSLLSENNFRASCSSTDVRYRCLNTNSGRQRIVGEGRTDGHPNLDCSCSRCRNNDNETTATCVNRNSLLSENNFRASCSSTDVRYRCLDTNSGRQRIVGEGRTDGHPNLDCSCSRCRNNDNETTAACVNRNSLLSQNNSRGSCSSTYVRDRRLNTNSSGYSSCYSDRSSWLSDGDEITGLQEANHGEYFGRMGEYEPVFPRRRLPPRSCSMVDLPRSYNPYALRRIAESRRAPVENSDEEQIRHVTVENNFHRSQTCIWNI